MRFLGNFCAGVSAVGTAIIKILIQFLMKKKSTLQKAMLITSIGIFNFFFCWPIVLLLYLLHAEVISFAFLEHKINFYIEMIWIYIKFQI